MKNGIAIALLSLMILPVAVYAHTGDTTTSQEPGFMMMQQIEDEAFGDELHEEMEDLMTKMMSGELSDTEESRMLELMGQYPGPSSMMMNRMMSGGMLGIGMIHGWNSGYGFGGLTNGIFTLLLWILMIAGIVALLKYILGADIFKK